jgi:uncharacterized Zn finger protein (UPF0148 family)
MLKICSICGEVKVSSPTPEGDEICPNCGDREMMDYEQDFQSIPLAEFEAGIKNL